jgi:hypothetical protein
VGDHTRIACGVCSEEPDGRSTHNREATIYIWLQLEYFKNFAIFQEFYIAWNPALCENVTRRSSKFNRRNLNNPGFKYSLELYYKRNRLPTCQPTLLRPLGSDCCEAVVRLAFFCHVFLIKPGFRDRSSALFSATKNVGEFSYLSCRSPSFFGRSVVY